MTLLLLLFTVQQVAERIGDVSLTRWTDDPQLKNLTALPADSEERVFLNNYYLGVYAGIGVVHGTLIVVLDKLMLSDRILIV